MYTVENKPVGEVIEQQCGMVDVLECSQQWGKQTQRIDELSEMEDMVNREAKALREAHGEVTVPKLAGEQWEPVPGYEDLYLVSNMGRVRRIKKYVPMCEGVEVAVMGNLLKPFADSKGHLQVNLYADGQGRQLLVHRLVASAFLGDIPKGHHVHHKDENKTNNWLDNLEVLPAADHLRLHSQGTGNPNAALDPEKVNEIRALLKQGMAAKEVAARYGVHPNTVKDIERGRRWKHLSYQSTIPTVRRDRRAQSYQYAMPTHHPQSKLPTGTTGKRAA